MNIQHFLFLHKVVQDILLVHFLGLTMRGSLAFTYPKTGIFFIGIPFNLYRKSKTFSLSFSSSDFINDNKLNFSLEVITKLSSSKK